MDCDLFVIGGGSGGVRAARMAATRLGWKVIIAERRFWGGTCVNVGCVPKKLFTYAAHYAQDFADARAYGWSQAQPPQFDWPTLIANKDREISRLNGIYTDLLKNAGVQCLEGRAQLSGPSTVQLDGREYACKRILIAAGGRPWAPTIPGGEHIMQSDDAFYLRRLPSSVCIVGGGYIAMEFACIFNGMGAEVHLVYRGERPLRSFDAELAERLLSAMRGQGIQMHLQDDVRVADKRGGRLQISLKSGRGLSCEKLFYATGRRPATADLFADGAYAASSDQAWRSLVAAAGHALEVDDNFATAVPGIHAIGDVIGRMALTPVALAEAMALVEHWHSGAPAAMDYDNIATAVFTNPHLATVGLSEQQAAAAGTACDIYSSDFRHLKHSLSGRDERVFIKMLVRRDDRRVLGLHLLGPDVGEIAQLAAVAMRCGARKDDFDSTIGVHPTLAEELVSLREPLRSI